MSIHLISPLYIGLKMPTGCKREKSMKMKTAKASKVRNIVLLQTDFNNPLCIFQFKYLTDA